MEHILLDRANLNRLVATALARPNPIGCFVFRYFKERVYLRGIQKEF